MARIARMAAPNLPHHLCQRGHNGRAVFFATRDYEAYLESLAGFRAESGVKIYGNCLMTNHVHLIVDPGDDAGNLGLLRKRLAGRHTRRLNSLQKRSGTVWGGRFKCSPIETERYLLTCLRYVDLNPVRARLVRAVSDYPWSSYRARELRLAGRGPGQLGGAQRREAPSAISRVRRGRRERTGIEIHPRVSAARTRHVIPGVRQCARRRPWSRTARTAAWQEAHMRKRAPKRPLS